MNNSDVFNVLVVGVVATILFLTPLWVAHVLVIRSDLNSTCAYAKGKGYDMGEYCK